MYTGLELAIIGYVLGFVIHIAFFRTFPGFYKFIDKTVNKMKPTGWCFVWPMAWLLFSVFYTILVIYCAIEYIVSGQWDFKW